MGQGEVWTFKAARVCLQSFSRAVQMGALRSSLFWNAFPMLCAYFLQTTAELITGLKYVGLDVFPQFWGC